MSLRAENIHVGCILRPRGDIEKKYPGITCEWNELSDHRDVNPALGRCPTNCRQDIAGQKHPIIVLRKNGDRILYVAMTGKPIYHDREGTQYSPIGHYFPPGNGSPHPARFQSRYWLENPNPWDERTIDAARQSPHRRLIELAKHSKLRLPHVYVQTADRFKAFGGHNTPASEYRLDEGSYYRLMDRLGLHASNYKSDISPTTLHRPHLTVSVSNALSSQAPASSTPHNQSDDCFRRGLTALHEPHNVSNAPGVDSVFLDKSPDNNLPNWRATLRNWIRPYNGLERNMKRCKSCKIRKISNPVAEDLPSPAGLNEPPLPYIITLQCTI
ncbi:hypothetical protein BHYA_0055g00320 [Botrytis hyacinthi]|uniref:Uncharacterized protein n=1 Tax=Botrytis hyacinthi TaxID=278943 RepID=A0A4Z1GW11_9HELO|nr:hypothetical protein BHYA_0055g00320 [Botrytis hyacinthi]